MDFGAFLKLRKMINSKFQTASLRLDDPVWDSAGGGLAEPDASQIPMPVFDSTSFDNLTFGTSPLNSMLAGNFVSF